VNRCGDQFGAIRRFPGAHGSCHLIRIANASADGSFGPYVHLRPIGLICHQLRSYHRQREPESAGRQSSLVVVPWPPEQGSPLPFAIDQTRLRRGGYFKIRNQGSCRRPIDAGRIPKSNAQTTLRRPRSKAVNGGQKVCPSGLPLSSLLGPSRSAISPTWLQVVVTNMHRLCATHKISLTLSRRQGAGNRGHAHGRPVVPAVSPPSLPTLRTPDGDAAIEPAPLAHGAASTDLEDITHSCVKSGMTLTRTMRSLSRAA
jgi:hypothetical protein